jgi:XTP/dITP diphosphohydrolase
MLKNVGNEFPLKGKVVFFATGNIHKYQEAKSILGKMGIAVGMLKLKGDEVQSESLQEIARKSVQNAYRSCRLPIFVEDAGLFVDALNGFPGPYAAYVYHTVKNWGVLKLLVGEDNRCATFQSVIAYCDGDHFIEPVSFYGESKGTITCKEREAEGKSGFGFDPIFQPDGSEQTFAEMTVAEKNGYSHRAAAIRKFAEWYKKP